LYRFVQKKVAEMSAKAVSVVFKPENIYKGTKLSTQVAEGNIMIGKQLPFTNLLKFNPVYFMMTWCCSKYKVVTSWCYSPFMK
jgi:hypothetical protein